MIETLQTSVLFVVTAIKVITPLALMFSGACAWIASRWEQPKEPGFWRVLNKLVNLAGGNVMYATNQATDRRAFVRLGGRTAQPVWDDPKNKKNWDNPLSDGIKRHYRDIL